MSKTQDSAPSALETMAAEAANPIAVPKGYWQKADGTLTPASKVKAIDKARTALVTDIAERAKAMRDLLADFIAEANQEIDAFVAKSAAEYGVTMRGAAGKGNVTLTTFDGRYKLERQIADRIAFDERLQIAKAQMDECVLRWSKGGNNNLKAIVAVAFKPDKAGRVSVGGVLNLRSAKIDDPQWLKALEIVADSMQAVGSAQYLRFYERNERGGYDPISLNAAAL